MERVGIVGVGHGGFAPMMAGVSYKELIFEAALRAYEDAGVDPRSDVDSFVCCSEDLREGTSIFDEYVPDQLGAACRPVQTLAADGLLALATGVMLIRSGVASVVALEAHSKASNILSLPEITEFALDPIFERPLRLHPGYVAGLEMRRFLEDSGYTEKRCAEVVVRNRRNALGNPIAAYPSALDAVAVMASAPAFSPLKEAECAGRAEGAVVVVLAREDRVRSRPRAPVWVEGIGWATDAPALSSRSWGAAAYARLGAERAYRQAGIRTPASEIDFAEVDDTFAYKQLQHLEALGLAEAAEAGSLPVNVSGGSLGMGCLFEANGLARVREVVIQLRGEAGGRQLPGVRVGLAQSWRGVPTTTGAVAVLSVDQPAT